MKLCSQSMRTLGQELRCPDKGRSRRLVVRVTMYRSQTSVTSVVHVRGTR